MKQWFVANGGIQPPDSLNDLRVSLLGRRGVATDSIETFLRPEYATAIFDPLGLANMQTAVDRVYAAKENGEQVVVHGDYDADGITATAILISVLRDIGVVAIPYLPDRHGNGYGLAMETAQELAEGMDLLLTVDCGITAAEEVAWLNTQKVDTIVIDHHTPPQTLPAAVAILHPRIGEPAYGESDLCGAGMAWKFAQAILRDKRSGYAKDADREKWLLDFAAIGTVADMVHLRGENRAIVQFGLEVLRRSQRPGVRALLEGVGSDAGITAEDLSFKVISRLNAAGRMDHPQVALDLLLAEDEEHAAACLKTLNRLNTERRAATTKVVAEAEKLVDAEAPVLFVAHKEWPAGVVGLAANKLARTYARPAVVVGSNGTHAVGSARSPAETNVLEILQQGEVHAEKLGGHAQAVGFTVTWEKLAAFEKAVVNVPEAAAVAGATEHHAEAVLLTRFIGEELVELLRALAPYGEGNTEPLFIWREVWLEEWRPVGKTGEHAKFTFGLDDTMLDGIGFGLVSELEKMKMSEGWVDVLGTVTLDEWRGRRRLQLKVEDVAASGEAKVTEVA